MKNSIFIIFLLFNVSLLAQPTVEWSKELQSTNDGVSGGIYSDLKGNAYGRAKYGTVGNAGLGYDLDANGAYKPTYIFGVDTSNGTTNWLSEIKPQPGCGCNYGADVTAMVTDSSGNLIVAGYFCNCGTMLFGDQNLSQLSHQTFLAKYSKTGQLLWVKTKDDTNNGTTLPDNYINAITTDDQDNIYLSIISRLANRPFCGVTLGPVGVYLMKIDPQGNCIWKNQTWDITGNLNGGFLIQSLKYFNDRLYTSSRYTKNFTYQGYNFAADSGDYNAAVLKMDTAGNVLIKQDVISEDVDVDVDLQVLSNGDLIYCGHSLRMSAGNTIVAINIDGNAYNSLNANEKRYFVKLDSSLNVLNFKNLDTNLIPYIFSHDPSNNLYFTAYNTLAGNVVDNATFPNAYYHIVYMDANLTLNYALPAENAYVCADKDGSLYTGTNSTTGSVTAFGSTFTHSGPYQYSQFQVKLSPFTTGISGSKMQSNAQLYPNPNAEGVYNLKITDGIKNNSSISITLTNILGQSFKITDFSKTDDTTIQINTPDLASGIYIINVLVDGKSYTAKLEKE